MTTDGASGRSAWRFRAGLPAELRPGDRTHPCEAHDLSRSGVLLTGSFPWPSERQVEVVLRSPAGDLELRAPARVSRVDGDEETTRVGVEFGDLAAGQVAALESLLARVIEGDHVPAALAALPDDATPQQVREALLTVALAHRVALAARALPPDRELLLNDPSPQVVDGLARNPRLLNHEVRKLLRRRDLLPRTLETLGRDARWLGDDEVRMFIITHPRAPFGLVDRLVSGLSAQERERVLRRPGLNPGVRAKLMAQTRGRRPG